MVIRACLFYCVLVFIVYPVSLHGAEKPNDYTPIPAAVIAFSSVDSLRELADDFTALVELELALQPSIRVVERDGLEAALSEQALGLSGASEQAAAEIGRLTGIPVFFTGRVIAVNGKLIVAGKWIGAATGRIAALRVRQEKGETLDELAERLAQQAVDLLESDGKRLFPPTMRLGDVSAELAQLAPDLERPVVFVSIPEFHISHAVPDPAAETELIRLLKAGGFKLVQPDAEGAGVSIRGEAFSEGAFNLGQLVSCRARVEIQAVEVASGRILFADAATASAVDIAESVAAKEALRRAGAALALPLARQLLGVDP